jgi:hypothetical protein
MGGLGHRSIAECLWVMDTDIYVLGRDPAPTVEKAIDVIIADSLGGRYPIVLDSLRQTGYQFILFNTFSPDRHGEQMRAYLKDFYAARGIETLDEDLYIYGKSPHELQMMKAHLGRLEEIVNKGS